MNAAIDQVLFHCGANFLSKSFICLLRPSLLLPLAFIALIFILHIHILHVNLGDISTFEAKLQMNPCAST